MSEVQSQQTESAKKHQLNVLAGSWNRCEKNVQRLTSDMTRMEKSFAKSAGAKAKKEAKAEDKKVSKAEQEAYVVLQKEMLEESQKRDALKGQMEGLELEIKSSQEQEKKVEHEATAEALEEAAQQVIERIDQAAAPLEDTAVDAKALEEVRSVSLTDAKLVVEIQGASRVFVADAKGNIQEILREPVVANQADSNVIDQLSKSDIATTSKSGEEPLSLDRIKEMLAEEGLDDEESIEMPNVHMAKEQAQHLSKLQQQFDSIFNFLPDLKLTPDASGNEDMAALAENKQNDLHQIRKDLRNLRLSKYEDAKNILHATVDAEAKIRSFIRDVKAGVVANEPIKTDMKEDEPVVLEEWSKEDTKKQIHDTVQELVAGFSAEDLQDPA
ncbi:MAG: hypothetical protein Q7S16_04715, partial [bacterium]|nr:hypothetical protein [bacterium]